MLSLVVLLVAGIHHLWLSVICTHQCTAIFGPIQTILKSFTAMNHHEPVTKHASDMYPASTIFSHDVPSTITITSYHD